jgi:ribosomal protein S18 acetylase RimI-like enzyme
MSLDDIPEAVALLREHDPGQEHGEWLARFERDVADEGKYPVVAVVDGVVVGYGRTLAFEHEADSPADAAPPGYYLLGLVVAPAYRGSGLGQQLTSERLRWLRQLAIERVYYYTHRENAASQRLHERLGFRKLTDGFWFPALPRDHAEVLYELRLHQ